MLLPEKKPISVIVEEERKRAEEEKELVKSPESASCACADRETTDQSIREKEVSSSIAFENALHNQVYVKRMNTRRRRDTSEMLIAAELAKDSSPNYDQVREIKDDSISISISAKNERDQISIRDHSLRSLHFHELHFHSRIIYRRFYCLAYDETRDRIMN
jgi:hypothetical protein